MLNVWRRCSLYSAHRQPCIVVNVCWLPAEFVVSVLVLEQLPFPIVVDAVELKGSEILRC